MFIRVAAHRRQGIRDFLPGARERKRNGRGGWICVLLTSLGLSLGIRAASATSSVARDWDEQILAAIRIDLPHPPVHARNLFHFSVAMYDAWAAYDPVAVGYLYHGKHTANDLAAARREAVSYAAYRILRERYTLSKGAAVTLPALDAKMAALGYNPGYVSQDPSTPAGLGNLVAATVSAYYLNDGARQAAGYKDLSPDLGGYVSTNQPLITTLPGVQLNDVNRWQPLVVTNGVSQNNIPVDAIQTFLGAQWLAVRPFALARKDVTKPWIDPGPPPHLSGVGDTLFRDSVVEMIRRSSELTPDDGVTLDISPAAFGNNTLGANDGAGYTNNPVTGRPYSSQVVRRGDFARVLAEFWADGPNSETPPGHWNVLANTVSDSSGFLKRLGGTGPILEDLEWEVKLYFALNGALHDAACAAWSLKRYYDGWRPISAVRFQGLTGQSSDPTARRYNPNGLPLIPGLIELVTQETAQIGGRHFGLLTNTIAILGWPGQPEDTTNTYSGVQWIDSGRWVPFQKKNFVTPSFPGYISGHSTFSRAAAEVLAAFTGSAFFPGGLGSYEAPAGSLKFEMGPLESIQLQWATYFDAADQAGISRIWGGIHPSVDDLTGRKAGAVCGRTAWALARQYFDGSILQQPVTLAFRMLKLNRCELSYPTLRGFTYRLQSADNPSQTFTDESPGSFQAVDSQVTKFDTLTAPTKFFRVIRSLD